MCIYTLERYQSGVDNNGFYYLKMPVSDHEFETSPDKVLNLEDPVPNYLADMKMEYRAPLHEPEQYDE